MNTEELPQETPPEILAAIEAADAEVFDLMGQGVAPRTDGPLPTCVICGGIANVSRTGRCEGCKHKRLSNNGAKIRKAREALAIRSPAKPIPPEADTVATLQAELAELRHLLSSRQAVPLEDLRQRVSICEAAGVEVYEDGAIKLTFNNELRKALVRSMPPVDPREREI